MQVGETVHAFNARVFGINKITSNRAPSSREEMRDVKVRSRNACRGWSWDEQRDDHGLYVKNLTLVFHTSPLNSAYLRLSPLISAYLRLSRIWGIFWFINSRNENTLTNEYPSYPVITLIIPFDNMKINTFVKRLHPRRKRRHQHCAHVGRRLCRFTWGWSPH